MEWGVREAELKLILTGEIFLQVEVLEGKTNQELLNCVRLGL
jgi:hypothetical protein